jgi:hypothetical protein
LEGPVSRVYLASVVLLLLIAPFVAIAIEWTGGVSLGSLAAKWFAFWACGVRLALAGVRQTTQPQFTAETLFGLKDTSVLPLVREIGMANLSMGALGIVSLFIPGWRLAAVMTGGLYYGLAAAGHIAHRPATKNEAVALVSDVGIFLVLAAILFVAMT